MAAFITLLILCLANLYGYSSSQTATLPKLWIFLVLATACSPLAPTVLHCFLTVAQPWVGSSASLCGSLNFAHISVNSSFIQLSSVKPF